MSKNKGGREIRKPKQPKKPKPAQSAEPKPTALNIDRAKRAT
jgi:hypothetical protein